MRCKLKELTNTFAEKAKHVLNRAYKLQTPKKNLSIDVIQLLIIYYFYHIFYSLQFKIQTKQVKMKKINKMVNIILHVKAVL